MREARAYQSCCYRMLQIMLVNIIMGLIRVHCVRGMSTGRHIECRIKSTWSYPRSDVKLTSLQAIESQRFYCCSVFPNLFAFTKFFPENNDLRAGVYICLLITVFFWVLSFLCWLPSVLSEVRSSCQMQGSIFCSRNVTKLYTEEWCFNEFEAAEWTRWQ